MSEKPTPQQPSISSSLKTGPVVAPKPIAAPKPGVSPKAPIAARPVVRRPFPPARSTAADLSAYVPDFEDLRTRAQLAPDALKATSVTIPTALFKLLVSDIVRRQPFDQDAYLATNPDVAQAMKSGAIASAHEHYVGHGYFEGRGVGPSNIDEAWYLRTNPDVAAAVRNGTVESAGVHYDGAGRREGRVGSADAHLAKSAWDAALNKR